MNIYFKGVGVKFPLPKWLYWWWGEGKVSLVEETNYQQAKPSLTLRKLENLVLWSWTTFLGDNCENWWQSHTSRRLRLHQKSKLNAGNFITAVNNEFVSLVTYRDGVGEWTKEESQIMDTKTLFPRLIVSTKAWAGIFENGVLYQISNLIRLYTPRN